MNRWEGWYYYGSNGNRLWKCEFVLWDITLCSQLKFNRRFGDAYRLYIEGGRVNQARIPTCFRMVSCLAYFSTVKIEATCSSETSVDTQRPAPRR
jgi:hypothetical protein